MNDILLCLVVLCVGAFAAPKDADVRIIGGDEAVRTQFPYLASVRFCIGITCQHACGGAIISSSWVLSAAHCIVQAPALGRYEIIAGILNLDDQNEERQEVRVKYAIIHPLYDTEIGPYDVAIYRLDYALKFSDQVQPIGMFEEGEEITTDVVIAGWGSIGGTDVQVMPNTVHYAEVPVISPNACRNALDIVLKGQPNPYDPYANICTGPLTEGVSICSGDSGGPVIDPSQNRLVGISSWTVTPCGTVGAPSIHNKVSHLNAWIMSYILN